MYIKLNVDPLSVNKAWQGRRFKSPAYKNFENDACKMLPFSKKDPIKEEIFVHYIYHIKNFGMADTFNFEKTLSDMLVKLGYILDDRYIRAGYQRKEKIKDGENEWIEIHIVPYTGQDIEILE